MGNIINASDLTLQQIQNGIVVYDPDTKDYSNNVIEWQVLGKDQDGNGTITIQTKTLVGDGASGYGDIVGDRRWSSLRDSATINSELSTWLDSDFYNHLSSDFKSSIIPITKSQYLYSTVISRECKLFSISLAEVGGYEIGNTPPEGYNPEPNAFTYQYYQGINSKSASTKRIHSGGTYSWWWLRSPYGNTYLWYVDANGTIWYTYLTNNITHGPSPACVLPSTVQLEEDSNGKYKLIFLKGDDDMSTSKLVTKEQAASIANAVIDKVKAKGYAVASELGDLATKDEVAKADLASALASEIEGKADAADILTYTIKKQAQADTGYAATYQLWSQTADSTPVETAVGAKINIPKDMVVENGSVVDITYDDGKLYDGVTDVTELIKGAGGTATAADAGKYIKLVISNADDDTLYISAKDLVDIYTEGNGIDITNKEISVVVNSSSANGLSVTSNGLELATAVASVSGVGGSAGAMSAADKEKLDNADFAAYTAGDGIDVTNHEISAVVDSSNANGLSVGANGLAMATATASTSGVGGSAGAMSATDKEKLDNADVTAYTGTGAIDVTSHVISVAAASASTSGVGGNAGTISAADQEKLDGMAVATSSEIEDVIDNLNDLDD